MGSKGAVIWLCCLAVVRLSTAWSTDETPHPNCSSTQFLEDLSAGLKQVVAECGGNLLSAWTEQQRDALLLSLRNLTDSLHKHQLKDKCPEAKVPDNGGLACVTVASKRYCKPLCNHGYDFGFLRRSRLYEECSEQTRYRWSTQYVGGNVLALCTKAPIQVSGAKSAYFPKDQDCNTTKSNSLLEKNITDTFSRELQNQDIQGQPEFPSLQCGRT